MQAEWETLDLDELRLLVDERDAALVELRHEASMLQGAPNLFKQRLDQLEKGVLSKCKPGTILEVKTPLLAGMAGALHQHNAMMHIDAVANHTEHKEEDDHFDPEHHHQKHDDLVLGRGFMGIDQKFAAEEAARVELAKHPHPIIEELHYAGNQSRPSASADLVVPDGPDPIIYGPQVQPHIPDGEHGFWLDHHMLHHADRPTPHHDVQGTKADSMPVDWLGRSKRGLPNPPPILTSGDWIPEAPKWLY
jgi:hypothetical protein